MERYQHRVLSLALLLVLVLRLDRSVIWGEIQADAVNTVPLVSRRVVTLPFEYVP